jgi:hypothetical protein
VRRLVLVAALTASGCIAEEGPMMEPGRDCQACHSDGGARAWSFSGTVFASEDAAEDQGVQGITVTVEDANGKRVSVRSNEAGNFYSAEKLQPPFRARVGHGSTVVEMEDTFEYGSCNACHTWPPRASYPDLHRLVAP